ncbi:MAG TPA: glycosyltransferase [Methylocystis sp.]|jgi:chlorobactene glucosyltransferase
MPVYWLSICWAWPIIVAWLIARASSQQGLLQTLDPSLCRELAPKRVAIIVPARDEESNIEDCIRSLLEQDYPPEQLEILVMDDHSFDGTRAVVEAIARDCPRLKILACPELPPGWIGKSHACWAGVGAVRLDAEWICFIDADMRASPELISSAMSVANSNEIDLLSLAPRHVLVSFAERLIIPCGLYCLSFCRDLRKVQCPSSFDATVTGQFMLVRRRIYDAVGGHEAIREFVGEDVALARLIKRTGARVELWDGRQLLSTRMYTSWETLWPGLAKNLVDVLGGAGRTAGVAAAAFCLSWAVWLVPIAAAARCANGLTGDCLAMGAALSGSMAAIGLHVAGAAYFDIPLWYGFLFPIAYTLGVAMTIDSVQQRLRRRIPWKGRLYPGKLS